MHFIIYSISGKLNFFIYKKQAQNTKHEMKQTLGSQVVFYFYSLPFTFTDIPQKRNLYSPSLPCLSFPLNTTLPAFHLSSILKTPTKKSCKCYLTYLLLNSVPTSQTLLIWTLLALGTSWLLWPFFPLIIFLHLCPLFLKVPIRL